MFDGNLVGDWALRRARVSLTLALRRTDWGQGVSAEIGSAVRMLPCPREMWWPRERTAVGALMSAAFGVCFENSGPGEL